jgi:hypothetical protein
MNEARQRKPLVTIAGLIGVAPIPAAVFAAWVFGSALERQAARWTTPSVTTSSTEPMAVPATVRNRRLVIVPEYTRYLGGPMDLKSLQRKAKQLIDRRGGTDSLKADAEELKDIAKGPGSVADKAKRAGDALKDPGAKGPDTPASPRPPAPDTPAPTAEPAAPPAPESDAPGTPKPGT